MKGTWWICAARTGLPLRAMTDLNDAVQTVGDPRAETLRWFCNLHSVVDCGKCLPLTSVEEHPFAPVAGRPMKGGRT